MPILRRRRSRRTLTRRAQRRQRWRARSARANTGGVCVLARLPTTANSLIYLRPSTRTQTAKKRDCIPTVPVCCQTGRARFATLSTAATAKSALSSPSSSKKNTMMQVRIIHITFRPSQSAHQPIPGQMHTHPDQCAHLRLRGTRRATAETHRPAL